MAREWTRKSGAAMNEQPQSAIGTVAQEAARLIEDMATMARSSPGPGADPSPYAGGPAQQPRSPEARHAARPSVEDPEGPAVVDPAGPAVVDLEGPAVADPEGPEVADPAVADESPPGVCSACGGKRDETPATCRLCPLCRGIALLRSVRPETVDLLADLAAAMAASLRDVATRTRAADPPSSARPASGGSRDGDRSTVQDIPVDDEGEGCHR